MNKFAIEHTYFKLLRNLYISPYFNDDQLIIITFVLFKLYFIIVALNYNEGEQFNNERPLTTAKMPFFFVCSFCIPSLMNN